MIATTALVLAAVAAMPEGAERGWVRPEQNELTRVLGIRWTAQLAEPAFLVTHPEQWTSPLVSQDHARVFAGTTAGKLEARSVSSGELLWKRDDLGSIGAAMAEHRGRVLLSSGSFLVALDDQTGEERWRTDISGGVGGRFAMTGTVAIVPVRSNAYVAIDAVSGQIVWRVRRPTPDGITMRGQAPAAIDPAADRAYLGFSDGALLAVSLSKGETKWAAALGKPGEGFADVDAEPVLDDGGRSVIAASYSGGLFKLDTENGRPIWRKEALGRLIGLTRAGIEGLLVASHGDGQVIGIAPQSGTVRWRYRIRKGAPTEPVYIGRGFALVGSSHGPVSVLEVSTGRPIQLIAPGSGVSATPWWRDPDLAILSNKGLLLMLRYGAGGGISL